MCVLQNLDRVCNRAQGANGNDGIIGNAGNLESGSSRNPKQLSGFESHPLRQPSLTLANERVSYGWQATRRLAH